MSQAQLAFELLRWCTTRSTDIGKSLVEHYPLDKTLTYFLQSRGIDSLYRLASGVVDPRQQAYDLIWRYQQRTLQEVLSALTEAGVRTLTFKGGELVARYYQDRGLGVGADLDLLVPYGDIEIARSVMYKLDFRHRFFANSRGAMVDRDLRDVADMELRHYELAPFTRVIDIEPDAALLDLAYTHHKTPLFRVSNGVVFVMEIDIHHNVAADTDATMFFDRALPSYHGIGETFALEDHLWFTLTRYYNEVALHDKISLRPFAYILPCITEPNLNWDLIGRIATNLTLGPTLYYFLAFVDRIAPGNVPVEILALVQRSSRTRIRDWGWQLGKLFDFSERFPTHAFDNEGRDLI